MEPCYAAGVDAHCLCVACILHVKPSSSVIKMSVHTPNDYDDVLCPHSLDHTRQYLGLCFPGPVVALSLWSFEGGTHGL